MFHKCRGLFLVESIPIDEAEMMKLEPIRLYCTIEANDISYFALFTFDFAMDNIFCGDDFFCAELEM